jgi:O-antigen/teichoic acid export membrane protein
MTAYIRRSYPWLASTEGKLENAEKRSLFKNVKALFLHKIGGTIVFGVDNLIISAFLSLSVVGVFNSYYMVIGAAQTLISSALSGVAAGVGNLLTENRPDRAYEVHRRLFFLSFWIVSCAAIVLWQTLGTFVRLWLGEGHTLDALTIGIVLANFYFMLMRGSVERFKEGAGIYHQDRYAPFVEAAINLGASLALVQTIGLPGVFLGTLISNLTVLFWLKPKLVYNIVFGKRLLDYLLQYGKYLLIAAVPLALTSLLAVPFEGKLGWGLFAAEAALCLFVVNGAYAIVFRNNDEFRYFLALGTSFARARLGKRRQRRAYEG